MVSLVDLLVHKVAKHRLHRVVRHRPKVILKSLRTLGIDQVRLRYLEEYYLWLDLNGGSIATDVLQNGSFSVDLARFVDGIVPLRDLALVNVGANIGTTILNAHALGCREFVAFEPVRRNNALLRLNTEQIDDGVNVTLHRLAVGDRPGEARINLNPASGGRHSFVADFDAGQEMVEITTLDACDLPSRAILWIDTEGYEMNVLRGAKAYLNANRPPIVLEVSPVLTGPSVFDELDSLLRPFDYMFTSIDGGAARTVRHVPGILEREQTDILALPSEQFQ